MMRKIIGLALLGLLLLSVPASAQFAKAGRAGVQALKVYTACSERIKEHLFLHAHARAHHTDRDQATRPSPLPLQEPGPT